MTFVGVWPTKLVSGLLGISNVPQQFWKGQWHRDTMPSSREDYGDCFQACSVLYMNSAVTTL